MSAETKVDPFTLEIIRDSLIAAGDEMFVTTQRTSMTPLVYEILDFAVGITDRDGAMITHGNGIPLFLGTIGPSIKTVLAKFPAEQIQDGDIFATNDPYVGGGTHLSDVTLMMPIFDGDLLIAWAANKAHWTDVGGKDTGTVSNETESVFQEGLQIPCVKLFDRGEPVQGVIDMIRSNVRMPDLSFGDLQAQAASCRIAAKRISELCEKYGADAVQAGIDHMFSHSAEVARTQLAQLPAGTYRATDYIDRDEAGNGPYEIAVEVTISPEKFHCRFDGLPRQFSYPFNCSATGLESAVRIMYKSIIAPDVLLNDGGFTSLEIECEPGTIFTAEHPYPVSTYWEVLMRITDLIWKALGPSIPDRLSAGHYLSVCCEVISGTNPETDDLFILFEPNPGGWGAAKGKDGERGLVSLGDGETFIMPVEVAEQRHGLRVEQYRFNTGRAGAGKWRGGEGVIRDYRMLAPDTRAAGFMGRNQFPAWGAEGGAEGSTNEIQFLDADGNCLAAGGMTKVHSVPENGVIRIITGSGGGWGDPKQRDPQLVAADVRNEFVSVEDARDIYGVEVDPKSFDVLGLVGRDG